MNNKIKCPRCNGTGSDCFGFPIQGCIHCEGGGETIDKAQDMAAEISSLQAQIRVLQTPKFEIDYEQLADWNSKQE